MEKSMAETISDAVRSKYGQTATSGLTNDHAGVRAIAEAFGYGADELEAIPAAANMGLSCGNPTATANLRAGEIVVDLGSGGGLDVFLAAQKVGPSGKAIGIDMTPQMIALAKRNAAAGVNCQPITNVEFHLGQIDAMPLADQTADVIISNCVINLATDKRAVFREMFRVLKAGGRVAVSDIALKRDLPLEFGKDLMAYVGCIAGAIGIAEYRQGLIDAGFSHVVVVDAKADLNVYGKVDGQSACCTPGVSSTGLPIATSGCGSPSGSAVHGGLSELLKQYDVNDYAASVKVFAVKPHAR
jgi:SAM-dependent methyltransferase